MIPVVSEVVRGRDVAGLVERLAVGEVRSLARALSLVEQGGEVGLAVARVCRQLGRRALRVGVTGAGGAGKSTLVDRMVRVLRERGERVGVVAIDPTSPYTGGALLGDRIRMQGFQGDEGVFIRSMASRGETGGVAGGLAGAVDVLEAAGFAWVIVETVGVGQAEVAVAGLVDITLLMLTPGMGDDVQTLKAGVMEAADVFVVNKADLPGADKVAAEVEGLQGLACGVQIPVVKTVGLSGLGVADLLEAVRKADADKKGKTEERGLKPFRSEASMRVDHLGVAVRSIEGVRGFWEGLGAAISSVENVGFERVRVAMMPMGETRVELLEPMEENSAIGRFLAKRGEGLHHVALKVDGVDARFAAMRAAGVRLASDAVRVGAGGHRYFFVHPESTGGVLVELVGE